MAEVRPIDANALMELARNHVGRAVDCNDIARFPRLDYAPVRHGKWEHKFYPTVWYGPGEPPEWICSACQDRSHDTYDYCPNCGAEMDGGKPNA